MHRLLHFLSRIFYSGCVLFSLTLPILPGWGAPGRQVSAPAVAITGPQDGQALQGAVTITGVRYVLTGGAFTPDEIADRVLSLVLDGVAPRTPDPGAR